MGRNAELYTYVDGQRHMLNEVAAAVAAGQWQELRVEMVGNRVRGFLNRQLVVEASDDTYQRGRVGVWTKADSVTCFDDIAVNSASG